MGNAVGNGELGWQWRWWTAGGGEGGEVEHLRQEGVGRALGLLAWVKEHQGERAGSGREHCLASKGARRGSRAEEGEGIREGGGVGSALWLLQNMRGSSRDAEACSMEVGCCCPAWWPHAHFSEQVAGAVQHVLEAVFRIFWVDSDLGHKTKYLLLWLLYKLT